MEVKILRAAAPRRTRYRYLITSNRNATFSCSSEWRNEKCYWTPLSDLNTQGFNELYRALCVVSSPLQETNAKTHLSRRKHVVRSTGSLLLGSNVQVVRTY